MCCCPSCGWLDNLFSHVDSTMEEKDEEDYKDHHIKSPMSGFHGQTDRSNTLNYANGVALES